MYMTRCLIFAGIVLVAGVVLLRKALSTAEEYSPTDIQYSIPDGPPVAMHFSASSHYQVDAPDSDLEYENLLPTGGHIVHVGNRPYTVTLFHQMKCLDILRRQYLSQKPPSPLTRHCLLYLRQTIICQSNPRIESVRNTVGSANRRYDGVCRDWTLLYDEAERNHRQYITMDPALRG
ncbi:hypothetical protein DFH06DRAFT_187600 [Mycena polygramma]|nr:hypothetical protein DFH06DRAFT_187600 [Mycena polygramma]